LFVSYGNALLSASSNEYKFGAGRQAPRTVGFALWLLYDIFYDRNNERAPTKQVALTLAREHGLNEGSASKALLQWSAHKGLIKPRTGAYSVGPRR
jgi:hypothetical protein